MKVFLDEFFFALDESVPNLQEHLHRHASIRVHFGKIKVWNASGVRPRVCDALQAITTGAGSNACRPF